MTTAMRSDCKSIRSELHKLFGRQIGLNVFHICRHINPQSPTEPIQKH